MPLLIFKDIDLAGDLLRIGLLHVTSVEPEMAIPYRGYKRLFDARKDWASFLVVC